MKTERTTHGAAARATWLRRACAVALAVLIGVTWRLWTPGTEFPRIPFVGWGTSTPAWVDWAALTGVLAGCVVLAAVRRDTLLRRGCGWLLVGSLIVSIVLDQHRLQPWAYELVLMLAVLHLARPPIALRLLRVLVASIYIHSALSKIDAGFFESHGRLLLGGLLDAVGISAELHSDGFERVLIGLFSAGEMLIGLGLLLSRTRRWALFCSILMHVLLLIALGPLGLDHKPGVLVWNAFFIAQNWLLFGGAHRATAEEEPDRTAERFGGGEWIAACVTGVVVAAPFLQPCGWFDAWPGWAVYSARPAIVTISIDESRVGELPASLRRHVGPAAPLTEWRPVNIDAWSFAEFGCPVYPEERYRLAIARALAERCSLGEDIRVEVQGPPDRWTGVREASVVEGSGEIVRECGRFRINTASRRVD